MTEHRNKGTGRTGLGVGVSSILVIFVLLCLVTFATLSLVSARADRNLSQKAVDHTLEYYTASNQAEQILAQADNLLADCAAQASSSAEYQTLAASALAALGELEDTDGSVTLCYSVPINENQTLRCAVVAVWPQQSGDSFYRIDRWQVESTGEWEPDEGLPVYGGDAVGALPGQP